MSRWVFVGCVLFVGCASTPPGVTFEIELPEATSRVELFLGVEQCTLGEEKAPCLGIAPPKFTARKLGEGFVMEKDSVRLVVEGAGTAVIRIEPDADYDRYIKRYVIVGLDDAGLETGSFVGDGLTVPARAAVVFQVALQPWQALLEQYPGPPQEGDHVKVWRRKADAASACVLVERVHNGQARYSFIVPQEDPDCDDVGLECDPLWHLAPPSRIGARGLAYCVADDVATGGCRLAGPPCNEVAPMATGCVPTSARYCFPDVVCTSCGGPTGFNPGCLANLFANAGTTFQVSQTCTFHAGPGFTPCSNGILDHMEFDGLAFLTAAGSAATSCTNVRLRNIDGATIADPIVFTQSTPLSFGAAADAVMDVSLIGSPCLIDLKWSSGLGTDGPGAALLELESNQDHVVIPFAVRFDSQLGCPASGSTECATTLPTMMDNFSTCLN